MLKTSLLFTLLLPLALFAQSTVKVVSYNVLNFPQGTMVDRQDTLAVILDELQPDLLLLQELKSEEGLLQIAEESCANLPGNYAPSIWEPLQSNPNSSWPLQQGLVYNADVMGMVEESVILTPYRDVNAYRMFVKNAATLAGDTTFLNVFVTHLKSSQGSDNEQIRLSMVNAFMEALEAFDPNVPAILAGDFNVYSSSEPAYEAMLDLGNPVVFRDPIDAPGNWTEASFGMPQLLTQSTRTSSIYGDGAGGGLDDRFDFALLSENLFGVDGDLSYVEGSYTAYGNTGLCFNTSLPNCETDDDVPGEVTWALYHMSDHLPIVFELESQSPLSVESTSQASHFPSIRKDDNGFQLRVPRGSWQGTLNVYTPDGRLVFNQGGSFSNNERLPLTERGMLLFQWVDSNGVQQVERH